MQIKDTIKDLSKDFPPEAVTLIHKLLDELRVKDEYTYFHCLRVSALSEFIAKSAGLSPLEQKNSYYTGLLHDIGKISTPESVLLKPSHLTVDEFTIMQMHPVKSEELLKPLQNIPGFQDILKGVRNHHERIDGKGYPDALSGANIPLYSRLILIADSFDSMTTDRPYRKGAMPNSAFQELTKYSGFQFDRSLVKIFQEAFPQWQKIKESQQKAA